jgi:hypothetical protein
MASNGLFAAFTIECLGHDGKPMSSSRIINRRERPSSCDSNSRSESNRSMRAWRLEQSSWSSHLQYISTRGSNCVHVRRSTWWEGCGSPEWRRHTRRPVKTNPTLGAYISAEGIYEDAS